MSRSAWLALVLSACGGSADPSVPEVRCPTPATSADGPATSPIAADPGSRPRTTLPAFANAVATGADVLELDVRRTADDVVVLLHDRPSIAPRMASAMSAR